MLSPFRCMPAGDETANGTGRYKERRIPQQRRRIQGPAAAYRAVVPFFQVVEAQAADSVRDDGVQRAGQEARFVRLSQADDAADVQRADPRMMQDASQPTEEGGGEVPVEDQGFPMKVFCFRRAAVVFLFQRFIGDGAVRLRLLPDGLGGLVCCFFRCIFRSIRRRSGLPLPAYVYRRNGPLAPGIIPGAAQGPTEPAGPDAEAERPARADTDMIGKGYEQHGRRAQYGGCRYDDDAHTRCPPFQAEIPACT